MDNIIQRKPLDELSIGHLGKGVGDDVPYCMLKDIEMRLC
jgi:hypothetical protein